jgi:enamine deaminase RidA (YjgF/YER057c/UK114 family)
LNQPRVADFRKIGRTVYTGGVTGKPGDVPIQIRDIMRKLQATLAEAGAGFDTVVKATVYLSYMPDCEQYLDPIWNEFFGKNPPARTVVQAGLESGIFVKIEMVAEARGSTSAD